MWLFGSEVVAKQRGGVWVEATLRLLTYRLLSDHSPHLHLSNATEVNLNADFLFIS